MQQISELTTTATSAGEFTNGSVSSGVSPTNLDAGWFNTVQRELIAVVEAGGLTLDPTNDAQMIEAIQALLLAQNAGRLLAVQVFTASGTYTPTSGTSKILVRAVGGGGGGAGVPAGSSTANSIGAGGGGGAYVEGLITAVPSSVTVTIGAAGAAGASGGGTGGTGGTTKFGSLITCSGGLGGGYTTTANSAATAGATSGGTASATSDVTVLIGNSGAIGSPGYMTSGSGGCAGNGGGSPLGVGGKGSANGAGTAGSGAGTGGGGALTIITNTTAAAGGAGTAGKVIVLEYA